MKVLVGCEESGRVREAFRKLGHDAISVDLLPSRLPGPHYQGDIFEFLNKEQPSESFDLGIFFPPCTRLTCAGAPYWKKWQESGEQQAAINFVLSLYGLNIHRIAIENPLGALNSFWRKADQTINPFQFGDPYKKRTCLWLKNLPKLIPTNIVEPIAYWHSSGNNQMTKEGRKIVSMPAMKHRDSKTRSLTFQGIANAMALQWGIL